MQPPTVRDLRPLILVGVLGLVGGCMLFSRRPTADEELAHLVNRLALLLSSSTVIASSIVAAAAILAAVVIPAITVLCVLRSSNNESKHSSPQQNTSHAMINDQRRPLLDGGSRQTPERAVPTDIVEHRSTMSTAGNRKSKGRR